MLKFGKIWLLKLFNTESHQTNDAILDVCNICAMYALFYIGYIMSRDSHIDFRDRFFVLVKTILLVPISFLWPSEAEIQTSHVLEEYNFPAVGGQLMALFPVETCQRLEIELPHGVFLNFDLSTNWD